MEATRKGKNEQAQQPGDGEDPHPNKQNNSKSSTSLPSKEIQNQYRRVLRGIAREDDPRAIRQLLKRRRRLEQSFPALAALGERVAGPAAAQEKDERFDFGEDEQ